MVRIEKSVTRDHYSASLGKPRDADQCPRDGFSYPNLKPILIGLAWELNGSAEGKPKLRARHVFCFIFVLNSAEHGILNAHKYQDIKKFGFFLGSDKSRMLFFPLINVKMPTIVGILTFMSRKKFMLSWVEHEKSFITSGPGLNFEFKHWLYCKPLIFMKAFNFPCNFYGHKYLNLIF